VLARSSRTLEHITQALTGEIRAAQRSGDLDLSADAAELALLILAILRGLEALGKAGATPQQLKAIGESAIAVLPRTV